MSYRVWLPLLLMLVLAVEGVLGAWASTRMVLHADGAPSVAGITRAASASCNPVRSDPVRSDLVNRTLAAPGATAGSGHDEHAGKSTSSHADDCSCADSVGCECLCVFTIYPPATALLFAGAHPPVSADTPLPALVLPAGRLSRVFRPPIV
ncbi:MAG: CopL family metal-binding regulatory protein [Stenotrophomonas sp.]